MTALKVNLPDNSYDINIGYGILKDLRQYIDLDRRVLIITDDGVPSSYAQTVADLSGEPTVVVIKQGETSKTLETVSYLLRKMTERGFTRKDLVIAVGGGVVGDISGFASAIYMRGIDFFNIPTTVLSAVDSSVGGKTGVNLDGVKNIVGAFKQPKGVLIDIKLTETLPKRQISNGLCEALKMAMTFDEELFSLFEGGDCKNSLEDIIVSSLKIKISVVEQDEKEQGLRRVLNFGHTIGHGIESLGMGYYHGECVALGMPYMCSEETRKRLIPVLKALDLPVNIDFDKEKALLAVSHDKKGDKDRISCIFVEKIGEFKIKALTVNEIGGLMSK